MKNVGYLTHVFIAISTAIVFYIIMYPLIVLPSTILIYDSVILGLLFGGSSFLLKDIVRYGNYKAFPVFQLAINYVALAILFTLCTVGLDFFLVYHIFPEHDILGLILPTIPVRVIIALLFFSFMVSFYGRFTSEKEDENDFLEESYPEELEEVSQEGETAKTEDETIETVFEHIAVKNGQKIDIVLIPEIIYLQAEGDYVMIHSTKGKFLKEQTMKYFDSNLPKNKFVRIHRSGIVNIDFIASIESYEKQNQLLILKNNMRVKVSLTGYKTLKKVLNL